MFTQVGTANGGDILVNGLDFSFFLSFFLFFSSLPPLARAALYVCIYMIRASFAALFNCVICGKLGYQHDVRKE